MSDVTQRAAGVLRAVGLTESAVSALEREDALFVLTSETLLYQDGGGTRRVTLRDLTRIHSDTEGVLRVETPAGTALSASLVGFDPARLQAFFNEVKDVTRRAKESAAHAAPTPVSTPAATPVSPPPQERPAPRPPVTPPPAPAPRPAPIVLGDDVDRTDAPDPAPREDRDTLAVAAVTQAPPPRPLHQQRFVPGNGAPAATPSPSLVSTAAAPTTPATVTPESRPVVPARLPVEPEPEADEVADLAPAPETPAEPPRIAAPVTPPVMPPTASVAPAPVAAAPNGPTPGPREPLREVMVVRTDPSLSRPASPEETARSLLGSARVEPAEKGHVPEPAPVGATPVRVTPPTVPAAGRLGALAEPVAGWAGRLRVLGGVVFLAALALAVVQFTQGAPLAGLWTAIAGGVAGIALLAMADLARLLVGIARALPERAE